MNRSSNAEFAQFRFVRDAVGQVIPLPAQGIDEKNLLVLDCERWGLARLHIFEGAAMRQDKLEAFQEELKKIADLRSDSVTRLITWGRDSEELFYADEMQDGEPLPEYLDRTGGVPFAVAAEWIGQLFEFFEKVPHGMPSFDRFTTLNFQVVIDRFQQVRPVFSEFYGWTKPGAQVQEHPREWYLAQIFCSLMAGVPVRTFYRESLPRNYDELSQEVQEAVLSALQEEGGHAYDRLKSVLQTLAAGAEAQRSNVSLPRLLVREWMKNDLADSYPGTPDFVMEDLREIESERYAIPVIIRGKPSQVQLLPGPEGIPREGWLNQHHDATRRPGRPMLHQLQVNYLEDRDSLTLIGEEQVDGVDLATLILYLGTRTAEEAGPVIARVSSAIRSLEQNTGSCAVWWLPPENILFVSGTSSVSGTVNLLERKGPAIWEEWGVKLRLHQTTATLREGVNLPGPIRALSRIPGKKFEAARRSAIALPLIFFLLTSHRFRWRRSLDSQASLPPALSDFLESFREALLNHPEEMERDLFEDFLRMDLTAMEATSVPATVEVKERPDDGFEAMLNETLFAEKVELKEATPMQRVVMGENDEEEPPLELHEDDKDFDFMEIDAPSPKRFIKGWWLALWSVMAALIFGYLFAGWNSRLGDYKEVEQIRFPVSDYEVPPAPTPAEVISELESYLMEQVAPDLLPHAGALGVAESRTLIDAFLASRIEELDPTAARLNALLVGLDGAPSGEVLTAFRKAAGYGDSKAQFHLAVLVLVKGIGEIDPIEVRKLLELSAKAGNLNAKELLAILLLEEGKPGEARRLMIEAAAGNHLGGRYHLGLFASNGVGREVDPDLAATEFQAAAVQGDARAMFALGRCYETGFGIRADFTEATRWIKMAAALDHPGALAWCQAREIEVFTQE